MSDIFFRSSLSDGVAINQFLSEGLFHCLSQDFLKSGDSISQFLQSTRPEGDHAVLNGLLF